MSGLGETTAGLSRLRKAMAQGAAPTGDGGMAEVRGFGFNPGALRMLAHVPEDLPADAPLVVVLHGCTQRAAPFTRAAGWLTLADRLGFAVIAPEQAQANNPNHCFNWFEPEDTARGAGEAASIHAMVQHAVKTYGLDARRVYVTGLSAGGAMTAALLAAYPETFAAGAVVAGLPYGVAGNVREAFGAMQSGSRLDGPALGALVSSAAPAFPRVPRLVIWHGGADGTVAVANAHALARQWGAVHAVAETPDAVTIRGAWTRSLWRDADGETLVELNLIAGLGHGTPLATRGEDPIGEVAPFMLEAGVSSSLEIARSWGLAPAGAVALADAPTSPESPPSQPQARGIGNSVMDVVSPHVSSDVQAIIAKALASAGLMR